MTMYYVHSPTTTNKAAQFTLRPGVLVKAFAVFGTFAVAASGAVAKFYGWAPSQIDLAVFGFFGGIGGALYAAIVENNFAGDRRRS